MSGFIGYLQALVPTFKSQKALDDACLSHAAGRTIRRLTGLPFDMTRETYASAVRIGFIQDSMLAHARFARTLGVLERIALGPLARRT